jgi:hypothetical protein
MSSPFAQALLTDTADGRSPSIGAELSAGSYGTNNRLVVSGVPCRVGEVNCVVVSPDPSGIRLGAIQLFCSDSVSEQWVKLTTAFQAQQGELPINRDWALAYSESFSPWDTSNQAINLDVFQRHLGQVDGLAYTLTSSLDGESYAKTFGTFSPMIVYAGEQHVAAGYYDGLNTVVMYWTSGMGIGSSYKDAKPLRSPVFRVEHVSEPTQTVAGSTTQPIGIASATASRVGALDRKSSATSTGPATHETRRQHACDANNFAFSQRKVDRSFLQDSQFWKYGTQIVLSISEENAEGSAPSLYGTPETGNVAAGAWSKTFGTLLGDVSGSFGGWSINASAPDPVFGPSLASLSITTENFSDRRWLTGVGVVMSHALNDGSKTFPGEWHYFGDWTRSPYTKSGSALSWSTSVSTVFRTQGASAASLIPTNNQSQETLDSLNAFDWPSYYAVSSSTTRTPKKVQASLYITTISDVSVGVVVKLRFTYETEITFRRAYYSLASASRQLLPLEQSFFGGPDWKVDATFGYGSPSVACVRKYAGVATKSISAFVAISQWRAFMQGNEIQLQDQASQNNCSIRLQSL